jgi:PEP-CTERM motif-containing protein
MFRRTLMTAAAVCALVAAPATAGVTISSVNGHNPYAGPTPTYDFEGGGSNGGAPITGGEVVNSSNGIGAQPWPFSSPDNHYWTVGPVGTNTNTGPGILDLSSFAQLGSISFIWGSIDSYNTLDVLDKVGGLLATFTGTSVAAPANGDQSNPATNRLVTLHFDGSTQSNIGSLRLTSGSQAFETDNFSVSAVPEPAIWAMLLIGFAFIGGSMRGRKRQQRLRLKYV